jgi:AcrR family transcriptional regulator
MEHADTSRADSLQTKKHEFVRQEIWTAAIDLFHEHGFDEVTIDQIADQAGISRRTFFRYFSSKEDVMASMVKRYGASMKDAIAAENSKLSNLEVAKAVLKKILVPQLGLTERIIQIANRSASARMAQFLEVPLIEQQLAKAYADRAKRKIAPTLEDRILAGLTLSATGLCIEMWVAKRRPMPEIVDEVFGALLHLCLPEKGKPNR